MKRYAIVAILLNVIIIGCSDNKYVMGENISLSFSSDTVHFDTVFTTIGTATKELRVINRNSGRVKIDRIYTADEDDSSFRLNIDGKSGNSRTDIEIAPGDSIFIFIDVIIDPNSDNSPVAINDSIIFQYNSKTQDINLLAWGQDINLIVGEEIGSETWSGVKPYVIYNSMIVDTGEILTIEEGVRVLFHRGSTMYVAGSLIVRGSTINPVIFSGDRYEEMYSDIPGQWRGVYFLNGSSGNIIDNLIIKNGESALHLGNIGSTDDPPDLNISNTIILHNTFSGISSLGATINASNCVISHCGYYSLYLAYGGECNFLHCTVNSIWDYSARLTPGVLVSDYVRYNQTDYLSNSSSFIFSNCIITGNLKNEIEIYSLNGGNPGVDFTSCILTIDNSLGMWSDIDLLGSLLNQSPRFISASEFDLRPDTLSPVIDIADAQFSLLQNMDIRGYSRFSDNGPDIGAYERQIGETSK